MSHRRIFQQISIIILIVISFSEMRWQQRTTRWKSCARKSENCNRSLFLLLWLRLIFNYADTCADIQSCWYRLWCWSDFQPCWCWCWCWSIPLWLMLIFNPADVNAWHCGSCWFLLIFIQEMMKLFPFHICKIQLQKKKSGVCWKILWLSKVDAKKILFAGSSCWKKLLLQKFPLLAQLLMVMPNNKFGVSSERWISFSGWYRRTVEEACRRK